MTQLNILVQTTNPLAQFDSVATRIHQAFDPLIEQLIARRDALLLELSQLREDYIAKQTTRRAAIEEIEQAQQQMKHLKVNLNIPVHQQANEAYEQGLKQLKTPTKLPCPYFQCPTLLTLASLIAEFGKVLEWEMPVYSLKKVPVLTTGMYGTGPKPLQSATGLAIDEIEKRMYIVDSDNKRIQIVSFEGEFITMFRHDKLRKPCGIAIATEHIFVTDTELHALLQFHKTNFELLNWTGTWGQANGQLNRPTGLCIDDTRGVFRSRL